MWGADVGRCRQAGGQGNGLPRGALSLWCLAVLVLRARRRSPPVLYAKATVLIQALPGRAITSGSRPSLARGCLSLTLKTALPLKRLLNITLPAPTPPGPATLSGSRLPCTASCWGG